MSRRASMRLERGGERREAARSGVGGGTTAPDGTSERALPRRERAGAALVALL